MKTHQTDSTSEFDVFESQTDLGTDEETSTRINEEVKTIEYAPAIFEAIRRMDNITD